MKRFFNIFSFALLLIFTLSFANTNISIKVNDKYVESDVAPFIKSGTTYVPIRFVANALKVDSVKWDADNKSVIIKDLDTTILLFANQKYAYINGEYISLDSSVIIVSGRTFVPIRFISEALNSKVDWDDSTYTVSITKKSDQVASGSTSKPSS